MSLSEKEIQTRCLKWLRNNGFFAFKLHLGGIKIGSRMVPNPAKGAPDIIAIKGGIFFGIEVKKPGGRVAPHQKEWHDKARRFGAVIIVAYSVSQMAEDIDSYVIDQDNGFY